MERPNTAMPIERNKRSGIGCGRTIEWNKMAPVPVPAEISAVDIVVTADDIKLVPEHSYRNVKGKLEDKLREFQQNVNVAIQNTFDAVFGQ